ncbi:hypothetical protein [Agrobacterium rosae]
MIELAISFVVGLAISFGLASRLRQRNRIVAIVGATAVGLILTIIVCGVVIGVAQFGGNFFSTAAAMPTGLVSWVLETGGEFSITALVGCIIGSILSRRSPR